MSKIFIIGEQNPQVGKEYKYSLSSWGLGSMPNNIFNPNPEIAKWEIYVLENGKWRKTTGNSKQGEIAPYTFSQNSLTKKGIKICVTKGENKGELIIKPKRAGQPKINKIELLDVNGKTVTKPLSYLDTLTVKAHCTDMEGETLQFTLWEDDAKGPKHNTINTPNKINTFPVPGTVKKGIAQANFRMFTYWNASMIANAKVAQGDKNEGKTHEYYATAEYFGKQEASNNVNLKNPAYNPSPVPSTTPTNGNKNGQTKPQKKQPNQRPAPTTQAPKKDTYKVPITQGAKTRASDPKGKIISVSFSDSQGKPVSSLKTSTGVVAKIVTNNMKGKTVRLKLWDEGPVRNDLIFSKDFVLIGDESYVGIPVTWEMWYKGNDGGDSDVQDYFLEVEYAGDEKTSGVVKISKDALPKKQELESISTSGINKEPEKKEDNKCICEQYRLIWGAHPNISCGFRKKVVEICADLWGEDNKIKMANNLMAVFKWESGGTFKPDAPNMANSGGTGLIQFMPDTAKSLLGKEITIETVKNYYGKKYNKTTKKKEDWYLKRVKEFADMTAIDQLDYVKQHFEPLRNKSVEFVDFYLQVLFPVSSGLPEHVVFADSLKKLDRPSESEKLKNKRISSYAKNSGMDINKDGKLMKSEIKVSVQKYLTEGLAYVKINKCENIPESKQNNETKTDCKTNCICNLDILMVKDGFVDSSQIVKNRVNILEQDKFTNSRKLAGIILHRTVTKTTESTINAFKGGRYEAKYKKVVYYGTHFIVGKDGIITQTAHLDYKTNHCFGWNSKSIGIEVVGMPIDKDGKPTTKDKEIVGWEDLTEIQAKSVACLSKALLKYYSLEFEDLHCHEHEAKKTKGEGEYVLKAIKPYFK